MSYDLFPAVDENYAFPPEVMEALEASLKLKNTVLPMTQTERDNLSGGDLWDGRTIVNTTTDRINRYDLGTTSWLQVADLSDVNTSPVIRSVLGMRNRVINGNFRINQTEYASATNCAIGVYAFDQWKSMVASSSFTFSAAPAGQVVTINSGSQWAQPIERANMPAGRYVLSHAGTAQGRVYNALAIAPAFAACPLVVDLDGTDDVIVEFQAHGGASKTISLVQLEQIGASGTVADATPFERLPYGLELMLCQRYFHRISRSTTNGTYAGGQATSTATSRHIVPVSPEMRVPPTFSSSAANTFQVTNAGGTLQAVSALVLIGNEVGVVYLAATTTGIAAGDATMLRSVAGSSYIDLSARL